MKSLFFIIALAFLLAVSSVHAQLVTPDSFAYSMSKASGPTSVYPKIPGSVGRSWVTCDTNQSCSQYPRGINCGPLSSPGWVSWVSIEPTQNNFVWTGLDNAIGGYTAHNLQPMFVFYGFNPNWATGTNPSTTNGCGFPVSQADFDDFVTQVVTRYKGIIKIYECSNEANTVLFNSSTVPQMVGYCQHMHDIVKAIDPTAIITTPSVTGGPNANGFSASAGGGPIYIQHLMEGGLSSNYFDVMNIHTYGWFNPDLPENVAVQINQFRNMMNYIGIPNMPIWSTEVDNSAGGTNPTSPEYVAVNYIIGSGLGIAKTIWYVADECGNGSGNYGCLIAGLGQQGNNQGLNTAGSAYRQVFSWLANSRWINPPARQKLTSEGTNTSPTCSPGAFPTNWSQFNGAVGITSQSLGCFTTANGTKYLKWRVNGTKSSGSGVNVFISGQVNTTINTWWTMGLNANIDAGSNMGSASSNLQLNVLDSGGVFKATVANVFFYPTTMDLDSQAYISQTYQATNANLSPTGRVQAAFGFNPIVGEAVDVTFNLALPNLDEGTQWKGDLTDANDLPMQVVWDMSGSNPIYSTNAQYTVSYNIFGGWYRIPSNSITLTTSPQLLRTRVQPVW